MNRNCALFLNYIALSGMTHLLSACGEGGGSGFETPQAQMSFYNLKVSFLLCKNG